MKTLNELQIELERLQAELVILENEKEQIEYDLDHFEIEVTEEEFDEFLDCEGSVNVCGLEFYPSDILKNCDPIAYRCSKSDYESNYDKEDCKEYQELQSELENIESKIEGIESQLEDIENEIESLDE